MHQDRPISAEIVGEVEKDLGEVQRSSSRPHRQLGLRRDKVDDVTYARGVHMYAVY
jgi:hypothetical protein